MLPYHLPTTPAPQSAEDPTPEIQQLKNELERLHEEFKLQPQTIADCDLKTFVNKIEEPLALCRSMLNCIKKIKMQNPPGTDNTELDHKESTVIDHQQTALENIQAQYLKVHPTLISLGERYIHAEISIKYLHELYYNLKHSIHLVFTVDPDTAEKDLPSRKRDLLNYFDDVSKAIIRGYNNLNFIISKAEKQEEKFISPDEKAKINTRLQLFLKIQKADSEFLNDLSVKEIGMDSEQATAITLVNNMRLEEARAKFEALVEVQQPLLKSLVAYNLVAAALNMYLFNTPNSAQTMTDEEAKKIISFYQTFFSYMTSTPQKTALKEVFFALHESDDSSFQLDNNIHFDALLSNLLALSQWGYRSHSDLEMLEKQKLQYRNEFLGMTATLIKFCLRLGKKHIDNFNSETHNHIRQLIVKSSFYQKTTAIRYTAKELANCCDLEDLFNIVGEKIIETQREFIELEQQTRELVELLHKSQASKRSGKRSGKNSRVGDKGVALKKRTPEEKNFFLENAGQQFDAALEEFKQEDQAIIRNEKMQQNTQIEALNNQVKNGRKKKLKSLKTISKNKTENPTEEQLYSQARNAFYFGESKSENKMARLLQTIALYEQALEKAVKNENAVYILQCIERLSYCHLYLATLQYNPEKPQESLASYARGFSPPQQAADYFTSLFNQDKNKFTEEQKLKWEKELKSLRQLSTTAIAQIEKAGFEFSSVQDFLNRKLDLVRAQHGKLNDLIGEALDNVGPTIWFNDLGRQENERFKREYQAFQKIKEELHRYSLFAEETLKYTRPYLLSFEFIDQLREFYGEPLDTIDKISDIDPLLRKALKTLKAASPHDQGARQTYCYGVFVTDALIKKRGREGIGPYTTRKIVTGASEKTIRQAFRDIVIKSTTASSSVFEVTLAKNHKIQILSEKSFQVAANSREALFAFANTLGLELFALFMDDKGRVYNPLGLKLSELSLYFIETLGTASEAFANDPTLMLQTIYYTTILGLSLSPNILSAINDINLGHLKTYIENAQIANNGFDPRIHINSNLFQLFCIGDTVKNFELLKKTRLLSTFFPALSAALKEQENIEKWLIEQLSTIKDLSLEDNPYRSLNYIYALFIQCVHQATKQQPDEIIKANFLFDKNFSYFKQKDNIFLEKAKKEWERGHGVQTSVSASAIAHPYLPPSPPTAAEYKSHYNEQQMVMISTVPQPMAYYNQQQPNFPLFWNRQRPQYQHAVPYGEPISNGNKNTINTLFVMDELYPPFQRNIPSPLIYSRPNASLHFHQPRRQNVPLLPLPQSAPLLPLPQSRYGNGR